MPIIYLALLVVIALHASCQRPIGNNVAPNDLPLRQVTDDLGRTVGVPVKITRVVSTAPSITESIFAVGAGDRLVGVTTFCDYPGEAKAIAKIGDTLNPNLEKMVALKPDIVFVSSASQLEAFTRTLEQNGIAVYVTNPVNLDDVLKDLEGLGELLGTTERVDQVMAGLKARIAAVSEKVRDSHKTRVFVQFSKEPLFTAGKGSFLNALVEKAGGASVTADVETAFPKLSKETALALRPDAIILSDSPDNQEPNEAFRNSPAVAKGRVYKINADILSRPGPRLVEALEQIARALHPDKFKESDDK